MVDDPRTWHELSQDEVLSALEVTPQGLSQAEAQQRLAQHGPNRLPEPPRRSVLLRFLLQFHNVLIYVLLGAALVTGLLDHLDERLGYFCLDADSAPGALVFNRTLTLKDTWAKLQAQNRADTP